MEWSGVDNVVLADLGAVHGEAVVMFGRDYQILRAGGLGDRHPLVGVKLHRVELPG